MKTSTRAGLAAAAAAVIATASAISVFAWGPERTTYTMANPADHVTFNSIVDNNQEVGDERYFVSASQYTGDASQNVWSDNTIVENGKEYVVRMYVHNNAASNLNLVAENVRAYVNLPTETSDSIMVEGTIYSSNATPNKVWDQTTFKSANGEKFNLTYVEGTAKYYNTKNGSLRTFNLDTANYDLFTDKGVLLGYDSMNGQIPGCIEYSGYLTFHVKAQFETVPETMVTKEVQIDGADAWSSSVLAKAGDKVNYRIQFKNNGNVTMEDVIIRDILPAGLSYVKGSTEVYNSINPNGVVVSDGIVSETGINIGDYESNSNAWIYFSAIVDDSMAEVCDNTILRNVIQANGGYGTVEDYADVAIEGQVCDQPDTPDEPDTPEDTTPVVPSLPKTGPESIIGGVVGAASLITAGAYYIISRKKLN